MIAIEAGWSLMDPWLLVAAPIVWLLFAWILNFVLWNMNGGPLARIF